MEEAFIEWERKSSAEISFVFDLLSKKLSDEPEELIVDLQDAEAWFARCGFLLAEANSFLDLFQAVHFPKEGTELEKKTMLASMTTEQKKIRNKIEALCDSIKQRLMLGASILKYNQQFSEHRSNNKELSMKQKQGIRGTTGIGDIY